MAKLYIKKHKLVAGGIRYNAGDVVELPDAVALELAKGSPEEFEVLAEPVSVITKEETVNDKKEVVKDKTSLDKQSLEDAKIADLKRICDEKGIAYKARDSKDKLIEEIKSFTEEPDESDELLDGLPPINLAGVVK